MRPRLLCNEFSSRRTLVRLNLMMAACLVVIIDTPEPPPAFARARDAIRDRESEHDLLRETGLALLDVLETGPWKADQAWLIEAVLKPVYALSQECSSGSVATACE
jgi:hypothetical protein